MRQKSGISEPERFKGLGEKLGFYHVLIKIYQTEFSQILMFPFKGILPWKNIF